MTVIDWLLDSDPAVRWQVLRDLADAPADLVAAERARIPTEGWGARLLDLEDDDGQWDGGALFPGPIDRSQGPAQFGEGQPWSATAYSLMLLHDFGVDPDNDRVRRAVELVKKNSHWEYAGEPFFEGEVEPCINGMVLVLGAYFGEDVDGVGPGCLVSNWRTAGGTARSRTARFVLLSTRRFGYSKDCSRTSVRPAACPDRSRRDSVARSIS
jgi:hypothetical protein